MKLKILIASLCVCVFLSCKNKKTEKAEKTEKVNKDEFTVSGTLKGLDVPYMFIDHVNEETGDRIWDTLRVKNESFSYTHKIKNTKRIAIWPFIAKKKKPGVAGKNRSVEFIARPGDAIEFKGDVTETFNAIPTGTSLCEAMNAFNKSIEPLSKKSAEISKRVRAIQTKLMNDKSFDISKGMPPEINMKNDSINEIYNKINLAKIDFIEKNPKSEISAYYLSNMVTRKSIPDNKALEVLDGLDETVKTSPYYINVATRLKGSEATKPGNIVPSIITRRTLDGKEFNLETLRGKYVLIDFWGTWCGPCVAEMPKVKEYKEKYKDELVILAINSGDTKQKIIDFIKPKGYDWMQLMSKRGDGEDNFVSKFNINGFPTKFIIDPEGKILHRYVGNAEESFEKLDELLGK